IASPTTAATTALNNVLASYGGFNALSNGGSQNSWPASFELSSASTFAPATNGTPSAQCGTASSSPCTYIFKYNLVVVGKSTGPQQVQTSEAGFLTITVYAGSASSGTSTVTTSFSSFGAFISNFSANTAPLVYGTITGPQFTNGSWNF